MASSPRTPLCSHRRHPSSLDVASHNGSARRPFSRRSSAGYSPMTPRSGHGPSMSNGANDFPGLSETGGNGVGSLADELADAWDEDDERDDEGILGLRSETDENSVFRQDQMPGDSIQESGFDVTPSLGSVPNKGYNLTSPENLRGTMSRTHAPSGTHEVQHGATSDPDVGGEFSPSFEQQLVDIEDLVRRGIDSHGSESDNIIPRMIASLRGLEGQSLVSDSANRLTNTHIALAAHLAHETRTITSLTSVLLSPVAIPLDTETVDSLLPLLDDVLSSVHCLLESSRSSSSSPLYGLHHLSTQTASLINDLNSLLDSMHIGRQTREQAARVLAASREQVIRLRKEQELREEGIRWIEKGQWEEKLSQRLCERVCNEVYGGFEEVCQQYDERLRQLEHKYSFMQQNVGA